MSYDSGCKTDRIEIRNFLDNTYRNELANDIIRGLNDSQKNIPSKYFYDARGSQLFEEICLLPEYYLTRTELSILKHSATDIMGSSRNLDLVELGSGANWKIRILLDASEESERSAIRYVPVDVSESALAAASEELLEIYPEIRVLGIVADFTRHMEVIPKDTTKLVIFLGSTLGNLDEDEIRNFLQSVANNMKRGDRFLLGLDMLKSKKILEAAYNDSQGITSEFNKNILNVLNYELNANFNPSYFDHVAFFNEELERIEMHLRANRRLSVEIGDLEMAVEIEEGETIQTENSWKFSRARAEQTVSEAGLIITEWFSDPEGWFSLVELTLEDS